MMFELAPFDLPAEYGESVLPLAEAKAHLSVLTDELEFDGLIEALRDAAVDMVERYCSLWLAERAQAVWRAECLPARVRLGVGPVTAITGFAYLDSAGAEQAMDPALLRIGAGGEVLPKPGQDWPSDIAGGIAIEFTAGFSDDNRPKALVGAAKMFLAHLFANREAVVTGTISGEIPLGFRAMCDRYRMPVI